MDKITINPAKAINLLLSKQQAKDKEVNQLFDRITEIVDSVDELNHKKSYDALISIEFLFTKIRIILTAEYSIIRQTLCTAKVPATIAPRLKQRESYLSLEFQRLNEIREDIAVVQKLVYSKSFQN